MAEKTREARYEGAEKAWSRGKGKLALLEAILEADAGMGELTMPNLARCELVEMVKDVRGYLEEVFDAFRAEQEGVAS